MSTMNRVSKERPCVVCSHPDWCIYGTDISICMRIASSRPKQFADGSIGYIHSRDGRELPALPPKKKDPVCVNSAKIIAEWRSKYGIESLHYLAKKLGVAKATLELLGCVKAPQHCVWGFPMHDGKGHVIGIRMRHENGRKWCEPGGHNGLFLPICTPQKEVVICEGPTDTAAALHLGLYAIGRFNCAGGINMINDFIHTYHIRRVTVVADVDNDREINGVTVNPGIQGAINLCELLTVPSRCVTLPAKDFREFVTLGGNQQTFKAIADQNVWNK